MGATTFDGTSWDLTPADRLLIEARRWGSRLRFAVMLLFFRARGRFPRAAAEVDEDAVAELARTLGVPAPPSGAPLLPEAADRTAERQRAEIRALLGFREATVADAEELGAWLRDTVVARTRDMGELTAEAEAACRAFRLEPPTPDRVARIVGGAVRAYDERRYAAVQARLAPDARARLEALVRPPPGAGEADDTESGATPEGQADAPLTHLRAGPGRASVASLREELARLGAVRRLGLPDGLFADWSPAELETCRRRVAVEAPYELRRHPEVTRLAWLAAYAHLRGRAVTDDAGRAADRGGAPHRHPRRAPGRAGAAGRPQARRRQAGLLFQIAEAAVAQPDGTVREVLFPVVGEQTLRDLVREAKATGPTYRTQHAHRRSAAPTAPTTAAWCRDLLARWTSAPTTRRTGRSSGRWRWCAATPGPGSRPTRPTRTCRSRASCAPLWRDAVVEPRPAGPAARQPDHLRDLRPAGPARAAPLQGDLGRGRRPLPQPRRGPAGRLRRAPRRLLRRARPARATPTRSSPGCRQEMRAALSPARPQPAAQPGRQHPAQGRRLDHVCRRCEPSPSPQNLEALKAEIAGAGR